MGQAVGQEGRNRFAAAALQHVDIFVFHDEVQQVGAQIVTMGKKGGGEVTVGIDAGGRVGGVGIKQLLESGDDGVGKKVAENDEAAKLYTGKRQGFHGMLTFKNFRKV